MELLRREREALTILVLSGWFAAGSSGITFRQAVAEPHSSPQPCVVVNLAGVDYYLDSAAPGALVLACSSLKETGGRLVFMHLDPRQLELLLLAPFATVREVLDDEQQAVTGFLPERQGRRFDVFQFVHRLQPDRSAGTPSQGRLPKSRPAVKTGKDIIEVRQLAPQRLKLQASNCTQAQRAGSF